MFLKSIKIKNFRNYHGAEHIFNKGITILVGDNAQGKSNFLESIYFLATAKSHKTERDEELIRYGEEVLRVEGVIENQNKKRSLDFARDDKNETVKLEVTIQLNEEKFKKRVQVNGIPRRVSDYSENLAVVEFAPEDINMVTGSPTLRRDHIDEVVSQVDRGYKKIVSSYEHIIIRKNKVLKAVKEGFGKVGELQFWCEQQVILGTQITNKRKEFFEFLNGTEKKFGSYQYDYLPSLVTQVRLAEYQSKEIEATVSLIGPHRDDFAFVIQDSASVISNVSERSQDKNLEISRFARNDKKNVQNDNMRNLSKYGSRGEQRTAVLDLKIAEASFMEANLGSRPVLLLDDIFSELDEDHREHVVELAKLQQTIITTVELDKYLQKQFKDAQVLKVESGKIISN